MIVRDAWYRSMPGLMVLAHEKTVLERILNSNRHAILLQIGGPPDARLVEQTKHDQLIFLDTACRTGHEKCYIQANPAALPIESDSISIVVVAHALELSDAPAALLEEVYRILKPGGKIIVFCFNRFSVWNLLNQSGRKKVFPKSGRCYSLHTIKKWLHQLHAEITVQQTLCFRPPFLQSDTAKKWLFLETLGQMTVPYFGAVIMVVATKKVVEMTPLFDLGWARQLAMTQRGLISPSSSRSY